MDSQAARPLPQPSAASEAPRAEVAADGAVAPRVGPILRLLLYGAALFVLQNGLILWWPAADPMEIFGEEGRLELAQDALLILGALLAIRIAVRDELLRPLAIGIAGFLVAILVREQNNWILAHLPLPTSRWVILTLVVTGILVFRWRRTLLPALDRFLHSPSMGWCAAGLIALLFAQLMDQEGLWAPILGEEIPYAARRAGEEIGELLAYALILFGLIEWTFRPRPCRGGQAATLLPRPSDDG